MHSKIMINDKADEIIEEIYQPLLSRYQTGLKTSIKASDFIFDCVYFFCYKCHKINPNGGGSNIDSPDWRKK